MATSFTVTVAVRTRRAPQATWRSVIVSFSNAITRAPIVGSCALSGGIAVTDSITANVRQSGEALPTLFAGLISADCHNNVSDCAAVLRAFAHTEEYDLVVARAAWIQGAQSDAICVGAFHTWQCREVEN